MSYRTATTPMTLSDVQGQYYLLQAFAGVILRTCCAAVHKISINLHVGRRAVPLRQLSLL